MTAYKNSIQDHHLWNKGMYKDPVTENIQKSCFPTLRAFSNPGIGLPNLWISHFWSCMGEILVHFSVLFILGTSAKCRIGWQSTLPTRSFAMYLYIVSGHKYDSRTLTIHNGCLMTSEIFHKAWHHETLLFISIIDVCLLYFTNSLSKFTVYIRLMVTSKPLARNNHWRL